LFRYHRCHGEARAFIDAQVEVSDGSLCKDRSKRLRLSIKAIFSRATTSRSLADRLAHLNPVLRGWANFYKHAWGAKRVLRFTDHYVWWTIYRWLRKKHPETPMRDLYKRYG
jgi:hypothetical protein